MDYHTVMIGAPIRNRAWILPQYLKHIYNLNYPKEQIILCFIINDSTDESLSILKQFQCDHSKEYKAIMIIFRTLNQVEDARVAHIRKQIYHSLAKLRNELLDIAKAMNVEYLFSIDSDILVPSDALTKLMNDDKDIVAAQIWNDVSKTFPNILLDDKHGSFRHYLKFPKKSLFRCDVTGAVYLLKKKVFDTRYGYHNQGEDVAFCIDAKKKGFEIWADSNVYCDHLMSKPQK
jgi:glycosyltransferase involved in cell wall biosynthesis